jgi:NAD(P)-dependent dehydrogenase (short-subunit alcohol dehydrogenase family)
MIADEPSQDQLRRDPLPLRGRTALVTGVSRRVGIGYAVARRLGALGASLFLHSYAPHDREQRRPIAPNGPGLPRRIPAVRCPQADRTIWLDVASSTCSCKNACNPT